MEEGTSGSEVQERKRRVGPSWFLTEVSSLDSRSGQGETAKEILY